jgi:SagB-type dehydrogenase family enzyme
MIPAEDPTTLSLLFHLNSEPWMNSEAYNQALGYEVEYKEVSAGGPSVRLAPPPDSPLASALRARRSCRAYRPQTLPAEALSSLLAGAYGVSRLEPIPQLGGAFFRGVPSAGGLFPLELYAVACDVEGLPDGLYHYDVRGHALEPVRSEGVYEELNAALMTGPFVRHANLVVIMTAVFERTQKKYGPRGYRYILFEAGHVAQTLCLLAAERGLGSLCMGGFHDTSLNRFLGLDGVSEAALYTVAVGHPAAHESAPVQIRQT